MNVMNLSLAGVEQVEAGRGKRKEAAACRGWIPRVISKASELLMFSFSFENSTCFLISRPIFKDKSAIRLHAAFQGLGPAGPAGSPCLRHARAGQGDRLLPEGAQKMRTTVCRHGRGERELHGRQRKHLATTLHFPFNIKISQLSHFLALLRRILAAKTVERVLELPAALAFPQALTLATSPGPQPQPPLPAPVRQASAALTLRPPSLMETQAPKAEVHGLRVPNLSINFDTQSWHPAVSHRGVNQLSICVIPCAEPSLALSPVPCMSCN